MNRIEKKFTQSCVECVKIRCLEMTDPCQDFMPHIPQTVLTRSSWCWITVSIPPVPLPIFLTARWVSEHSLRKPWWQPGNIFDLYQRMVQVDDNEPTQMEHYLKKVALHRFMIWRDTISSTTSLGFRVKGMRKRGITYQHYKIVKSEKKIFKIIRSFLKDYSWAATEFLKQLQTLRSDLKIPHSLILMRWLRPPYCLCWMDPSAKCGW